MIDSKSLNVEIEVKIALMRALDELSSYQLKVLAFLTSNRVCVIHRSMSNVDRVDIAKRINTTLPCVCSLTYLRDLLKNVKHTESVRDILCEDINYIESIMRNNNEIKRFTCIDHQSCNCNIYTN
ncbi:hypothetical protein [Cetacean poxvirus 1]|nr:hypothetical protein [Cetacean poxvirus 1]QHG62691.1 hypothetical protein [Cetacean poxvirus 1]